MVCGDGVTVVSVQWLPHSDGSKRKVILEKLKFGCQHCRKIMANRNMMAKLEHSMWRKYLQVSMYTCSLGRCNQLSLLWR